MGNTFSAAELKQLQPHLKGFNPQSLSRVIWDTIKRVGIDDKYECFGIHFEDDSCNSPTVTFWDEKGLEQLPHTVFLQILEFIAETTLEDYSMAYDLDKSSELKSGIYQLQLALDHLKKEIAVLRQLDTTREHYQLDSTSDAKSKNESASQTSIIEQIRARRGSYGTWLCADDNPKSMRQSKNFTPKQDSERSNVVDEVKIHTEDTMVNDSHTERFGSNENISLLAPRAWDDDRDSTCGIPQRHRNSEIGIEGIMTRMPELRARYEKTLSSQTSSRALQRAHTKIRSLTFLRSPIREKVASSLYQNDESDASYSNGRQSAS